MYQLSENKKIKIEKIYKIVLCEDEQLSWFIFLKNGDGWLQLYIDEGVLFIQKILLEMDFDSYLEDLSQQIVFQYPFDKEEDLTIDFSFEKSSVTFLSLPIILSVYF
ncbi:hypothetical protein [Suttonella ornithocola]|uniref:Uncharacterized protein n=1 Tax=Suttonella ornithocola TaxID=279832 RepID=A0A380MN16_9GAMM|nr:hypothetical protein [Suttonella ornithocola]SUO94025.1 Uncharacterised protein [Suttonella ornithocola]